MPMQQQNSSFARKLGSLVSAANAECRDKPVDTGNRRLPAGIRNGVAKLSAMYTKEQTEETGVVPKGSVFFRASAIVMSPESYNGERIAGMVTQTIIPMCNVPARGNRKESTFKQNWYTFQNLFKLLGIMAPNEDSKSDPTGEKVEAYYFSAMRALTDPAHPVYITFSTRGWTPPATPQYPNPSEIVYETWHGLASATVIADIDKRYAVDSGVRELPPSNKGPAPSRSNPGVTDEGNRDDHHGDDSEPDDSEGSNPDGLEDDRAFDNVAELVMIASEDPGTATSDGTTVSERLEKLALNAGWTREQILQAADWSEVGEMALNAPTDGEVSPTVVTSRPPVTVGSHWKFARRTRDGAVMKNTKGVEFPARSVEVVTVDDAAQTCTLRTTDDNRMIVDIRTRTPLVVECKWLEPLIS